MGAAAYNYFGKSISDLSLEECAYLAALPKGPQNYHPIRNKGAAMGRRNWVIGQMAAAGWVTRAAAAKAQAADLKVQTEPSRAKYKDADYFVEEVRRQGLAILGERLNAGGLYVRTTLDPALQSAARDALMNGLEAYDRRHGWRGAWGHVDIAPGWQTIAKKQARPAERRTWQAAVITDAGGRVQVADTGQTGGLVGADVAWAKAGKGLNVGDLVFVAPADGGGFNLKQVPRVNGALVAMEPNSGRVLAMVGGYSFSLSNFNRATQAMRQPGSSFKPIVYATALENGYTPASIVMDSAISLPGATAGSVWTPENYSRNYLGALTLRRGLELSRNTMTVRLAQGVGMKKIRDMAIRMGVVKDMAPVLSMSLGAGETTPFKLTAAYASFVNGGRKVTPHLIELVQDREGQDHPPRRPARLRPLRRRLQRRREPAHRAQRRATARPGDGLPDHLDAAGRGPARHRHRGPGAEPPGRRQDGHHQRVPQRLVRRLHAADRGRASSWAMTTTAVSVLARPAPRRPCRSSSTS